MSELLRIHDALLDATKAQEPTWLASVIRVEGSAYRKPGARLLFGRDGQLAGSVSGSCLDREVARIGAWLSQQGPVVRAWDGNFDDESGGARAGCGGKVQLLIEPVTPELAEILLAAAASMLDEQRFALATVIESRSPSVELGARLLRTAQRHLFARLHHDRDARELERTLEGAVETRSGRISTTKQLQFEALLEVIEPDPHLFVFGVGQDAVPVAKCARLLGWNVSVCTANPQFSVADRFAGVARLLIAPLPDCFASLNRCARPLAVVMNHDYERDRATVAQLLKSDARYIGVLGPARRTERMLREIGCDPADHRKLGALHGPAGLHLGAENAEEIAFSIVAEAQAVLAGASGVRLRDRLTIHDAQPPEIGAKVGT